jgi:uncharacterized protein YqeY
MLTPKDIAAILQEIIKVIKKELPQEDTAQTVREIIKIEIKNIA